jgi:hypothetical protein
MKFLFFIALLFSLSSQNDLYECILFNLQDSPTSEQLFLAIEQNDYAKVIGIIYSNIKEFSYLIMKCFSKPKTNIAELREYSSNLVDKFFGIKNKFTFVSFNEEIVLYNADPKITAKLVEKCSYTFPWSSTGFITFEQGYVVDKSGVDFDVSDPIADKLKELTGFDIRDMSYNIENKFKSAVQDGSIVFKISWGKIEIAVSFESKSMSKDYGCAGTVILTISKGNNFHKIEVLERAFEFAKVASLVVALIILAIYLGVGVAGIFIGTAADECIRGHFVMY